MDDIRCEVCGQIIAQTDGNAIYIKCHHANPANEQGYRKGWCKTMNKVSLNTEKESVEDEAVKGNQGGA